MKNHICLSGCSRNFPSSHCSVCRGTGQDTDEPEIGPANCSADATSVGTTLKPGPADKGNR